MQRHIQVIQSIILLSNVSTTDAACGIMPWSNLALVIQFNLPFYIQVNTLVLLLSVKKKITYWIFCFVRWSKYVRRRHVYTATVLYCVCLYLFMAYYCGEISTFSFFQGINDKTGHSERKVLRNELCNKKNTGKESKALLSYCIKKHELIFRTPSPQIEVTNWNILYFLILDSRVPLFCLFFSDFFVPL